jgi:hypothetical protein
MTEENFPKIEKELLEIRHACEEMHTFIYGKKFKIVTDHEPLETIYKKGH